MTNRLDLISSAGRIVAGNVAKANPLDMNGKPRAKPQYFFALAIAKTDPAVGPLMQQMYQFASQQYSQFPDVTRRIQLGLAPGTQFAWKIDDGDSAKLKERPGHAGCWIFKFSTTIAPKAVDRNNQMIDPVHIKTGYYADVAFSVSANGKTDHTAGLYVNPNFVRLLGYGEEIVAGPTAEQRFGAAPAPQMGSAAPLAPGGAPGGFPGAGQQSAAAGGMATGFPGVGGNPAHNAPASPAGTMAGGVAPSLPGFGGNGFPANAPAVPDGATAVNAQATGAAPGFQTASHSSVPGFAHGGAQA
jgi:hypothetical protein